QDELAVRILSTHLQVDMRTICGGGSPAATSGLGELYGDFRAVLRLNEVHWLSSALPCGQIFDFGRFAEPDLVGLFNEPAMDEQRRDRSEFDFRRGRWGSDGRGDGGGPTLCELHRGDRKHRI